MPAAGFGFAIILRGSREYGPLGSGAGSVSPLGVPYGVFAQKEVFISYVQEDGAVAYEIAAGLESQGYSSWYYERDCPAGADYFEETHKAISDCEAMVIIISPRSLPSDQITREIVRAVESSKATFPLLLEVTHDDYTHRRPGWHQAMAAANATRIPPERVATVVPSLVAGLGAKGIQAHANGRWASAEPPKQTTTVPQAILNSQLLADQGWRNCCEAHDGRADSDGGDGCIIARLRRRQALKQILRGQSL